MRSVKDLSTWWDDRGHIADPYIVEKITTGKEDRIRSCVGATYCSNFQYCIQNPATAREAYLPHKINKAESNAPCRDCRWRARRA